MKTIQEESATITISETEKISKELEVFYNPVMKLNRDMTILLFKAMPIKDWIVADILAGTGIRTIRLLKEISKKKISHILANDLSEDFIENNLKLNKPNMIAKKYAAKNIDMDNVLDNFEAELLKIVNK